MSPGDGNSASAVGDKGAIACSTLVTVAGGRLPRRGAELESPKVIRGGAVAWSDGVITYAGPVEGLDPRPDEELDGVTVVPGFVDCHTHLPFFGWRAEEYEARLAGRTYRDLHGEGGIYRSARMLAEASDQEVITFSRSLAAEMLAHGTTTLELKTGYGLSVDAELRQARLARRLADEVEQTCSVTLLACHAVPRGVERRTWVRTACQELIPVVAAEGLADAVDVYVEDIAFSLADLASVAEAARAHGLRLRVHADQLGRTRAAEAAVALGAASADHLNHTGEEGVAALGSGGTVGVVLPASTFVLGEERAPVAALIEAGAALAIATDCNPGTSPVASMPEAIAMGCALYGLPPLAALTASTANPAWVLGLDDRVGTLEAGKRADFVVLDGEDFRTVPYRPGHNPVLATYVGGRRAFRR